MLGRVIEAKRGLGLSEVKSVRDLEVKIMKSVIVRHCVHVKDTANNSVAIRACEWTRFAKLLPVFHKYVVRLFYEQKHLKSYIDRVVTTGQ